MGSLLSTQNKVSTPYLALDKHVARVAADADEQTAVAFLLFPELQDKLDEVDGEAKQGEGAYNGARAEVVDAWRGGTL